MRESLKDKINKRNLSEQAVEAVKSRILSIDYEPGTRFVIDSLSAELGISFTPVRDAIRELVNQGFVVYDGNSYKVRTYSQKDIDDLFAIRTALEVLAVELATNHSRNTDIEAIRTVCGESENAISENHYEKLTNLDIEFHELITQSAGNDQLGRILHNIRERSWYIRRWIFGLHPHKPDETSAVLEHRAILERMLKRDAQGAALSMRVHMKNSEERTLNVLPPE